MSALACYQPVECRGAWSTTVVDWRSRFYCLGVIAPFNRRVNSRLPGQPGQRRYSSAWLKWSYDDAQFGRCTWWVFPRGRKFSVSPTVGFVVDLFAFEAARSGIPRTGRPTAQLRLLCYSFGGAAWLIWLVCLSCCALTAAAITALVPASAFMYLPPSSSVTISTFTAYWFCATCSICS
jgi:hypothetical protein